MISFLISILFVVVRVSALECPGGVLPYTDTDKEKGLVSEFCQKSRAPGQQVELDGPFVIRTATGTKVTEGTIVNGQINGEVTNFYPDGRAIKSKSLTKNGKKDGFYREFYDSGTPLLEGQYAGDKPLGDFKVYGEDQKVKLIAPFEDASKLAGALVKKRSATQAAEIAKRMAEDEKKRSASLEGIKKNWTFESIGSVRANCDKKTKICWGPFAGLTKWHIAVQKCRGIGWRLPTDAEWLSAIENGATDVLPDTGYIFWTGVDASNEKDATRTTLLGSSGAWAISVGVGQPIPADKFKDENAVRCVKYRQSPK